MNSSLTRRATLIALGATTTVVGLGLAPALASTAHLDAELLALEPGILQAKRALDDALDAQGVAETAYFDARRKARAEAQEIDDDALREAVGFTAARVAVELAFAPYEVLIEEVASTPARTVEGLLFKARMSILDDEGSSAEPLIAYSLVGDIVAVLGGRSASA